MDQEDIKEIVRILLSDVNIEPQTIYYDAAIDYYLQYGIIPDINYIVGMVLQNNLEEEQNVITGDDNDNSETMHAQSDNDIETEEISGNDSSSDDNEYISRNYNDNDNDNDNVNDNDLIDDIDQIIFPTLMNNETQHVGMWHQSIINPDSENAQIENISENTNSLDVKKVIKNIDEIPLFMFKNIPNNNGNKECHICFDQFVPTDIVRVLPCSHNLHRQCIDEQLKKISYLCPYCKTPAGDYVYYNL